ncbi:MAG TPA: hypothetical protein VM324_05665 [Egibacteraceae bacterium]|jgi:hypothetical protein|nr:hypothetical protein [Egibacteraceae bacterium]
MTEGSEHEQTRTEKVVGEVGEEPQRRLVRPMDVVEDDEEARPVRRAAQGLGDGVEEAETVLG